MESLEQLHKQLDSLDELRSIVKTMKALSAASIRQYEQAVDAVNGYCNTVERGLYVALKDLPETGMIERTSLQPRGIAAVIFGSDHGLCGRFNEEISEYAREKMNAAAPQTEHQLMLAVGARVAGILQHDKRDAIESILAPGSASQMTATVQRILLKIDEWREQGGVNRVHIFYNRHASGTGYQATGLELFPMNLKSLREITKMDWPSRCLPTFTMDREVLLSRLLRQHLFVSLFRACAESQASEHASRLEAMRSAQRNLDERLDEVRMNFRRARQSVITSELLDVVTGFEAVSAARR